MADEKLDLVPDLVSDALDIVGVAGFVVRKVHAFNTKNDRAMAVAEARSGRDWQLRRDQEIAEQIRALEDKAKADAERIAELDRTLRALVEDPQYLRVQRNYELEGAREATDERKRMLAMAAAGSMRVDLSISQLARVERTIRELDPPDIRLLAELDGFKEPPKPVHPPGEHVATYHDKLWVQQVNRTASSRLAHLQKVQPSGHILMMAGCVAFKYAPLSHKLSRMGVIVTDLGCWVLAVMDPWLRSQQADEPMPPQPGNDT